MQKQRLFVAILTTLFGETFIVKRLLLALLGLLLVVFVGASVYVSTIDWNQHKNIIAQQFSEATGKKIVFAGPVSFKFLPTPYLSAADVKIFNPSGQEKALVEIPSLVAKLSLGPLLKGKFNVQRMELKNPQINIEVLDSGKLNWQSDLTPEQRRQIEDAQIALNSVSLSNAVLNFEDPFRNVSLKLENLNGEIVAQSILGPYRIEGNYVKDNTPEGFAISMGRFSDSFATSLNLAITHPVSESYVRFDGSFALANKVLNGNVIIESKKFKPFVQANFSHLDVDDAYDYPLALTADISVNEQQFSLSNIVVKYGETQGAGNLQMPFNDGFGKEGIKPRINVAFNFTDLDLNPVVHAFIAGIGKYAKRDAIYNPNTDFDLLADIKSVRTTYKGQLIKDFVMSFDWMENILTLNNFGATLPGDTNVKVLGTVSTFEDKPFYNLDTSFDSSDFLRTLDWLDIAPEVPVASTYRKALGNAKFTGNLMRIQVSPFSLTLDKSSLSGELGIKLDTPRADVMLIANTDMINFDNYIAALPDEEKAKTWAQRMLYRFSKFGFLNDFDMQANVKMNVGIYEGLPFENVSLVANLLDGKLTVEDFKIGSVANSSVEVKGGVSGFGASPIFEDFNYRFLANDLETLISKLGLRLPKLDYKKLNTLQAWGALSGDVANFSTETNVNLKDAIFSYRGVVNGEGEKVFYDGDLKLKHPDFVRMLNDFDISYNPEAYSLGLFDLETKISGDDSSFQADSIKCNIGFNAFRGTLRYEHSSDERPSIWTNMEINKFEIERFLNHDVKDNAPIINPETGTKADFLPRPLWAKNIINYDFYKSFDLAGHFSVQELSYRDKIFRRAESDVSLLQGNAEIKDFSANYLGGKINAALKLQMRPESVVSGKVELMNAEVNQMKLGGSVYAIGDGTLNADFSFEAPAESESSFIAGLDSKVSFVFDKVNLKGLDLQTIYDDVVNREKSDGLSAMFRSALTSGNTALSGFKGQMNVADGKFSFSNTVLEGENFVVTLSGNGDLSKWDMESLFDVRYEEPRYLPGFSFSLNGPINAPVLDVDAGSFFNWYQNRQDRKNADIQAAELAEKEKLNALAQEQKKTSEALIDDIQNNLEKEVGLKHQAVFSDEANSAYAEIRQTLRNIVATLTQNSAEADSQSIDDALLQDLQEVNARAIGDIERQKAALARVYMEDTRKSSQAIYEQVVENYNHSKMLNFRFNSLRDGFRARLAAIETDFNPENDVNVSGWQNFIEDKFVVIENQDKKLLDDSLKMQNTTDVGVLEQYKKQLQDLNNSLAVDIKNIEDCLREYQIYMDEKISEQEKAYASRLRKQEIQRKLEENTGSISIKKSGKTVTVRRNIEDIEEAEKLADEQEIKVLDFSRPKVRVESDAPKNEVNVVKKGRVKSN